MNEKPVSHTRRIIEEWAHIAPPTSLDDLTARLDEWIDGLMATQRIRAQILEEQLATARGEPRAYRVIDLETGDVLDLDAAERVMDHIFALGGLTGLRRFLVYKHRLQIRLPRGGEVGKLARWLEQQ
jgi:hypothetical protein